MVGIELQMTCMARAVVSEHGEALNHLNTFIQEHAQWLYRTKGMFRFHNQVAILILYKYFLNDFRVSLSIIKYQCCHMRLRIIMKFQMLEAFYHLKKIMSLVVDVGELFAIYMGICGFNKSLKRFYLRVYSLKMFILTVCLMFTQ